MAEVCQHPRRGPLGTPDGPLKYIAARLEAAVDGGTEQTLRTVASQVVFALRMLASEAEEPEPPKRGPLVLNTYTGRWIPVAAEDRTEFARDPEGFARRAQERFRAEWLTEHAEEAP